MKIILACLTLALVACTRGHCSHVKSRINYLPLFGVRGHGRRVRGAGGGSSGVSGFYIPASRGGGSGAGNSFQRWGAGATQDGNANAVKLPGSIAGGSTFSPPAGSYGAPASGRDAGRLSNLSGGSATVSNSQGWIPMVGIGASDFSGPIGGGASGSFRLEVGNAGAGSDGTPSASAGASGLGNEGGNGGTGGGNYQCWNNNQGGNTGVTDLAGPIGSTDGSLLDGSVGTGAYGPPSTGAGIVGGSYQGGNGSTDGNNYETDLTSNKVGNGDADESNYQDLTSNHVGNGGTGGSNFQGWNSNQGGKGGDGASDLLGPIGGASDLSLQIVSAGANTYGLPSASAGTGRINNDNRGIGGGSFQGYNGGSGGTSNQNGNGGGSYQGYNANAGNVGFQGGNGGVWGGNHQGYSVNAGSVSSHGGNGGIYGSSIQVYSKGPTRSSNKKSGRGAVGRSVQGSSLGDYQEVPVGFQTSEGRNVEPQLLEQIRNILYQEEISSGAVGGFEPSNSAPSMSYGAPSSAYGVPRTGGSDGGRSDRIVGVVLEDINQSIQIAQFHQTSSSLTDTSFPEHTISSGAYGAP